MAQVAGAMRPLEINIEPKTVILFLGGQLTGPYFGAASGVIVSVLHQLLHPGGGLVLASLQAVLWAGVGACGGALRRVKLGRTRAALLGAGLTLVYDLALDTSGALMSGFSPWAS